MRKIIILLSCAILVGLGLIGFSILKTPKEKPKKVEKAVEKTAFISTVENKTIPLNITATGNLISKENISLFSEVQGLLESGSRAFRPGMEFKKGETLITINKDEFYAGLQAQRSQLENLIASIMPDLRLDYPLFYQKWVNYLNTFNVESVTKALPKTESDQEKLFITSRGIYNAYYSLKTSEEKLIKYTLIAPFTGILTEANVAKGALVRPGQQLGEFINTSALELVVSIDINYVNQLKVGKPVQLTNLEKNAHWTGYVSRINGKADLGTQTIKVYIDVKGSGLKQGMFLQANIAVNAVKEAIEIPRNLLLDGQHVFIVNQHVLDVVKVTAMHFKEETVVIKGLKNGVQLVSNIIPGAYQGMSVKSVKSVQ